MSSRAQLRRFAMPSPIEKFAVFAAPAVFVVLWASGFIGAKFGLPYAEPMTFLSLRMLFVGLLIGIVIVLTRPPWPNRDGMLHSAVTGVFVHGLYLGGVFIALQQHLPAGLVALVVSLQPVLTTTLANRWLGERVIPRQWVGLLLGMVGVALIVQDKAAGDTTALGWTAAVVALDRHDHRHALSEASRRPHRLAAGLPDPIRRRRHRARDRRAAV